MNGVALASALVANACGGEVGGDDAGLDGSPSTDGVSDASLDGSVADAVADVTLPDGFNPLDCNGGTLTFGGPCTAQTEQVCESWTQDRAFGAYGHGHCQNIGGGSVCTLGDYCPNANQECQCSSILICAPGQVCYSEMPDGSTHCKQACTPGP